MQKRSLSIAGHRTSIALEPEFWSVLDGMAAERGVSLARLIGEIDAGRIADNLTSALRVAALRHTQSRNGAPSHSGG